MPEIRDFDPGVANLLHRGLDSVQPALEADAVAAHAMTIRPGDRGRTRMAIAWAAVVLVAAAALVAGSGLVGGEQTRLLDLPGYTLRYPADWTFYPSEGRLPGGTAYLGYLASGPVDPGPICRSVSCRAANLKLRPGQAAIALAERYPLADQSPGPSAGETMSRVDGMPAYISTSVSEADDLVSVTWRIREPQSVSSYLELSARVRGPDRDALEAQVRAIVDSLHWDTPPRELPTDEGSVSRAVRKALATKSQENRGYACFPLPGETSTGVVNTPPEWGNPAASFAFTLPVKCETRIEETEARLWKLTLVMSWDDLGAAGSETIELWIDVDGNVVSTSARNEGQLPPAP